MPALSVLDVPSRPVAPANDVSRTEIESRHTSACVDEVCRPRHLIICAVTMTCAPGTRFGPYEVTSSLGTGGMGEVYRARDGRLDRDVALKVLPSALTGDARRLLRFKREAQIL